MEKYNSYLEQWAYLKREMGDLKYYYDKVDKMFNEKLWNSIEDADDEEEALINFYCALEWLEKASERVRESIHLTRTEDETPFVDALLNGDEMNLYFQGYVFDINEIEKIIIRRTELTDDISAWIKKKNEEGSVRISFDKKYSVLSVGSAIKNIVEEKILVEVFEDNKNWYIF